MRDDGRRIKAELASQNLRSGLLAKDGLAVRFTAEQLGLSVEMLYRSAPPPVAADLVAARDRAVTKAVLGVFHRDKPAYAQPGIKLVHLTFEPLERMLAADTPGAVVYHYVGQPLENGHREDGVVRTMSDDFARRRMNEMDLCI